MNVLVRSLVESSAMPSGIFGERKLEKRKKDTRCHSLFPPESHAVLFLFFWGEKYINKKYLQVGDGGFGSLHLDDAFCSQVLLPVKDQ